MENNNRIPMRPISKTELALSYMPALSPHSAVNRLMAWITQCQPLFTQLLQTGYRKTQKQFSGQQHALILQYLGEP